MEIRKGELKSEVSTTEEGANKMSGSNNMKLIPMSHTVNERGCDTCHI